MVEAEVLYDAQERPTDTQIRAIESRGPREVYPPPSLRHAGKAPRKDSPPPGSLRSQVVDVFGGHDPRRRRLIRLAIGALAFLIFGGGATVFREQIRGWLEVVSVAEWKAADDAKAAAIASAVERITELERREAARATEEERRRSEEKLRVLEEQNRALQDEVRRAYRANPGRAPVVVEPGRP